MKNKHLCAVVVIVCMIFTLCTTVSAYDNKISPAFDIIASELNLVKTGLISNDIIFTAEDFENALGVKKVENITISSLPPITEGVLMLGSLNLMENQTISRKNLNLIRFVPASNNGTTSQFTFSNGDNPTSYDVKCTLNILTEMNFAPTITIVNENGLKVSTQKNITVFSTLRAIDPENDDLQFIVTKEPRKGMLTITDKHYGNFKYTPTSNYTGKDSFEYVVCDKYGNYSDKVTMSIKVEKPLTNIVYKDMQEHWAHNAAIKMAANNIMVGEKIGNEMIFNPNAPVSRCEFLVMAMNAIGIKDIASTVDTGFIDDSDIPTHMKGYVATAIQKGYIKGCETEAGLFFYPNYQITRAEAAVILNNMVNAKQPVIKPVFADTSVVPTWAEDAIYALCEIGIINGTGEGYISPYQPINKAQTAQILCSIIELN